MPDILSKETVIFTLQRMGYELVVSEGDNVLMFDPGIRNGPWSLFSVLAPLNGLTSECSLSTKA